MLTMKSETTHAVRDLRIGKPLDHDLYDQQGVLLLRGGAVITQRFVDALTARGIQEVSSTKEPEQAEAPPPEEDAQAAEAKRKAEAHRAAWGHLPKSANEDATAYDLAGRARPPITRLSAEQFEEAAALAEQQMRGAMDHWSEMGGRLTAGKIGDAGPMTEMLSGLLPTLSADVDLASVMLKLRVGAMATALRQGIRTAIMSMHLARQIGYAPDRVVDAGLVGLLCDVGMSRLPEGLVEAKRPLTPNEWLEVRRHPAYSADHLEKITGLRKDIATAVYQHHERLDGSGYPHGRSGFYLHPLAKLVAVADSYAAVSDDRPHRAARSTHHAVRAVLEGVKRSRLDRDAAKVLLETVTLFPVGTRVTLSDQSRGEVLRTHAKLADRPLVALHDAEGKPGKKKVDLSVRDELKIDQVHDPEPLAVAA